MLKYVKQNKHVITVAFGLFIVSMSTLFFFLGSDNEFQKADYKTDFIQALKVKSYEEQEKQYREFLHNEKDAFAILDLEGNIEFSSANFETTLGYTKEEVNHHLFPLFLNTEDLSIFLGAFSKVNQTHESLMMIGPYRLQNKNGEDRFHMGSMIPLFEKGKIMSVAIVSKDIGGSFPTEKREQKDKKNIPENGKKIFNESNGKERLMAEK